MDSDPPSVPVSFDLSGRAVLTLVDSDPSLRRYFNLHMDPFTGGERPPDVPEVLVAARRSPIAPLLREVHNPARDGLVTAHDGERLYVVARGRSCAIPNPVDSDVAAFEYEPGFPIEQIFARIIRPALHLSLLRAAAVAVHSAAVEVDGRAVLVAGWSESGKTETALALMERGARFVSDKWTVVGADAEASAFPIGVGVRRWVLPHLPRLRKSLPRATGAQMRLAAVAAAAFAPMRARSGRVSVVGRLAAVSGQAVALADRAALTPSELRAAYGQRHDPRRRAPLGTVLLLTTVPSGPITATPVDRSWAAARLARTAAYERRELFWTLERAAYADPVPAFDAVQRTVDEERRVLELAFARTSVVEVRAPFPVDPRLVADVVERWL